jgi:hypothetical protein
MFCHTSYTSVDIVFLFFSGTQICHSWASAHSFEDRSAVTTVTWLIAKECYNGYMHCQAFKYCVHRCGCNSQKVPQRLSMCVSLWVLCWKLSVIWNMRTSFIIAPSMTALVHRQPVSAGIFHSNCFAEDNDKCDFLHISYIRPFGSWLCSIYRQLSLCDRFVINTYICVCLSVCI